MRRRALAGAVALALTSAAACASPDPGAPGPPATSTSPAAAGAGLGQATLPASGAEGLEVLGTVDYDGSVRTPSGEVVPLVRFRGRPLFLNVWATWCPPCVAELGSIRDLMASVDTSRVGFLLVSPEAPETVRPFLDGLGYPLPAAVEHTRMPEAWGVRALPTTVVVDAHGRIVLRHRGAADWDQPAVRAFLTRLAEGS